jgi:hypothetical protein
MKRLHSRLTLTLAAALLLGGLAPIDADAHHRRHHRHVLKRVPGPVVHVHAAHGHGPVAFAYVDAEGRRIFRDRKGHFFFGPRGGHVHFAPVPPAGG